MSQEQQIQAMNELCSLGSAEDSSCWIGLRHDNVSTRFEWKNGQELFPTEGGGDSVTNWGNGTDTPTAADFALGEETFCVQMFKVLSYEWVNVDCVAPELESTESNAALCGNPLFDENYPSTCVSGMHTKPSFFQ